MCGIAGIFRRERDADGDEKAKRLLRGLTHRGPDGQGIFHSTDGRASLVHTRLSILGRGPAGHQPMTRSGLTITFNGEIYNFRSLRNELRRHGERFVSETDTEIVLALYEREGSRCLARLRGMFAFAIWDERAGRGFLARDRFGIKPLYYGQTPGGDFFFGSETKALVAADLMERRIDPAGLHSYLTSGSVAEPLTMFEGLRSLEAGHWMEWQNGASAPQSYFQINFSPAETFSLADMRVRTREGLLDSVRHHFVSDVPVGIFLSGGLDSGALTSLALETGPDNLTTFSLGVEDGAQDESEAARTSAKFFRTDHREMLLTRELAGRWVEPFLEALDQPTVDGFNTYCVSKLAADHGFRVVLSGLGADELFGGYPSFWLISRLMRAGDFARPFRPMLGPFARRAERLARSGRCARVAAFLQRRNNPQNAYATTRSIFSPHEAHRIVQAIVGEESPQPQPDQSEEAPGSRELGDRISQLEMTCYLRNQLLRDADVMSMAHGVELRVPFVDHELFATLRTVPSAIRLAPGKRLLRDSICNFPCHETTQKRGFTLPFDAWLTTTWSELKEELRGAPHVPLNTWSRKWSLIVLQRWLRRHGFSSWRS